MIARRDLRNVRIRCKRSRPGDHGKNGRVGKQLLAMLQRIIQRWIPYGDDEVYFPACVFLAQIVLEKRRVFASREAIRLQRLHIDFGVFEAIVVQRLLECAVEQRPKRGLAPIRVEHENRLLA